MLDGLKGMAGIASMMKDLPRIKARMEEVRSSLGELRVEATSAGGDVRVAVSGELEVVDLQCTREVDDEVIRATVNDALSMAREEAQRRLAEVASELGLPMPGEGGLPGLPSL